MNCSTVDIPFLSEALSGERIWVILKVANLMRNTDRNPVRSLLEFSTKAAFPSTTLESLVLDLEVKRSQIFEQAST